MSDALQSPEKKSYVLVSFEYGDNVKRFTNWGTHIDPEGANYRSVPAMACDLAANVGKLDAKRTTLTMPINEETEDFLSPVSRGTPFPPTKVTIVEISTGLKPGDTAASLTMENGWVRLSTRNPNNVAGTVKLEIETPKANLKKPTGISCDHECANTLYKYPCSKAGVGGWGPQANSEKKLGTLASISGKTVTISGSMSLAGGKSYFRGFIERDGARIGVRKWESGTPNTFHLTQQPPEEWVGQQVAAYPGCDKSKDTCDTVWNNLESFMGLGYAIPAFDPTLDLPSTGLLGDLEE